MASWRVCDVCEGKGVVASVDAEAIAHLRYCGCPAGQQARYGLPAAYRDWTLDTWPGPRGVKERVLGWSRCPGAWLLLSGPVGTGKTGLAVGLYRHIVDSVVENIGEHSFIMLRPRPIQFWRAPDLVEQHKSTFGVPGRVSKLEVAEDIPLLFLDDVGAERATEFNVDLVAQLIQRRHAMSRRTVITTNLTMSELAQLLSERVLDRLRESATLLAFEGKSLRQRGAPVRVVVGGGP